ncbi:MAG: hypothetical protein EBY23_11770, partial [Actinobacteria bacterium]|nr:hypothetical protein [Actinomycetota bacterium]
MSIAVLSIVTLCTLLPFSPVVMPAHALAPTVINVSSTTADGGYGKYDVIAVTVQFSAPVTVTGTPYISLETGESDANVNYSSGSTTDTLVFNYTVTAGNAASDLDYKATSSLSGTIKLTSNSAQSATTTLPAPGSSGSLSANKAIVIQNFSFSNPQTNQDTGLARDPNSGIFFLDSGGAGISSVSADTATLTASWISAAN